MFLFDANDRTRVDDYRDAVHDSSGLLLWTGKGEQIWRPLANPRELQISAFADSGPRGFGLMQRERDVRRLPGPRGALREAPVALGRADRRLGRGRRRAGGDPDRPRGQRQHRRVLAAARSAEGEGRVHPELSAALVLVGAGRDDAGRGGRDAMRPGVGPEEPPVRHRFRRRRAEGPSGGRAARRSISAAARARSRIRWCEPNPATGGWRLSFQLNQGSEKLVEMHARLMDGDKPLTETWLYRWTA